MEILLILAFAFLILSTTLKLSFGIIKLAIGLVCGLLVFVLLPVGLVLFIPLGLLFLIFGFIKLIF